MVNWQLRAPVALFVFNRPDTTRKVFEAIRCAKPSKLFVIADGPRRENSNDAQKCEEVRRITEHVDWPCEVMRNYSDLNIGCDQALAKGMDWLFERVDKAIILEDDCVVNRSFFRYCDELLERYETDERIMTISGRNYQFGRRRTDYSYYFSRYGHLAAFATWRRTWKHFDSEMSLWPEMRDGGWLNDWLGDKKLVDYFSRLSEDMYAGKTYRPFDVLWGFSCCTQGALAILPNVNLVTNVGYSPKATHTKDEDSIFANLPVKSMNFPLSHPPLFIRDAVADAYSEKIMFLRPVLGARIRSRIKKLLKQAFTER